MSPLAIEIALHYHCVRRDYEYPPHATAQPEILAGFVREGLLIDNGPQEVLARYEPTPKLHAYVGFLCAMPLPVMTWKLPGEAAGT